MLASLAFILKANLYVGDMELQSKSKHGLFQIDIFRTPRYHISLGPHKSYLSLLLQFFMEKIWHKQQFVFAKNKKQYLKYCPHSFLFHFHSSKNEKQNWLGWNKIEKSGFYGLFLLFKVLKMKISKNKPVFFLKNVSA